jgi:transketolase
VQEYAQQIRRLTLEMIYRAKASHIGSCFSMADLLATLYFSVLHIDPRNPQHPLRDRCIISKGHAAACVYATLSLRGFFPQERLDSFSVYGSSLLGHLSHHVPGVECSTGSLGYGLSIASGIALAAQREHLPYHTFALISDGELNEGSIWEGVLFAGHHCLKNLTLIIDYNQIQSLGRVEEILVLDPLRQKFEAFHWDVEEIDGHDHIAINQALKCPTQKPKVVIAHTIKGKGVSFMENNLMWHYKNPSSEQYAEALQELCAPLLLKH